MNNQTVTVTTNDIEPRHRTKVTEDGVVAQKQDRPLALLVARVRQIFARNE